MQTWFVVVMGVVTVFLVLVLIILLCYLLGWISRLGKKKEAAPVPAPAEAAIPDRSELAAAIAAAVSEYSGTDASAIRILSIKKI